MGVVRASYHGITENKIESSWFTENSKTLSGEIKLRSSGITLNKTHFP